MAGDDLRMSDSPDGQSARPEKRTMQTTLSAIGDLGVAGSGTFARGSRPGALQEVMAAIVFFLFVYGVTMTLVNATSGASLAVHLLLMPLAPTLFALVAFLSSRIWKRRALELKSRLKVWQGALESLGHEAANAANATQANLAGFFEAHPELRREGHLEEIAAAARKMGAAVQKASGDLGRSGEN